jgi:hypothetical protein
MKNMPLVVLLLLSATLHAQYYYNDIIATKETNGRMKAYIAAHVQSVTAAGYDPRGAKTADFNEWQDVQANGSTLKITTRNGQSISRTYYRFDNKTRLISARDSATDIETITIYTYDANDNLVNIKATTKDAFHDFDQTKERQWQYKNGKPEKLLLIVNGNDSMEYTLTLDEHKNVADEMITHRGGTRNKLDYAYDPNKIYYFYDDQNRLTDITRYNIKADKLLPDFMFEYDDSNRVIQKITVMANSRTSDYLVWRYGFNEQGLKTKDVLYDRAKELKGKIEYSYTVRQ